jgi:lysophospholipase
LTTTTSITLGTPLYLPFSAPGYLPLHRSVLWSVDDKGRTGLDTSLTDIWSCALAYHFLTGLGDPSAADTITTNGNFFTNDTSHGAGILWSHMINIPTFQKREFPLPIVVADTRPPGFAQLSPNPVIPLNSTQYEFTPWELGSYDPDLSAFVDVRFMGTHLVNGKPTNSSACVTEFDQTSFIFGTSSSLFNVRIDA